MNHYIRFLALFFTIFIFGCTSSVKRNTEVEDEGIPCIDLTIAEPTNVSFPPLSDAAEKVEFIPLEVTDESVIGNVKKIEVTQNDIWVTYYKSPLVFRFSRDGKFKNAVGKVGQGPEEYIDSYDFFINEALNEVYTVSTISGIKVYDFDNKFVRTQTKALLTDELFTASQHKFLLHNNSLFLSQNLCVIRPIANPVDSLWSIALVDDHVQKKKLFKNPAHLGREELIVENRSKAESFDIVNYWMETPGTSIDFYGGDFMIKYPDTDTIYQYDDGTEEFKPAYSIFTNEKKGEYEFIHQWIKELKAFDYFSIKSFYPTKDYIFLTATKGNNIFQYRYDNQNQTIHTYERAGEITERKLPWFSNPYRRIDAPLILHNDLYGGNFTVEYRSSGKYWVDVLEYGSDNNWIDVEEVENDMIQKEEQKREFLKLLNKTNDNSNPILIIATLK